MEKEAHMQICAHTIMNIYSMYVHKYVCEVLKI